MYGAFIRRLRTSRQLSQPELAGIAGVTQPNLSAYEHDRRIPTADTLNKIVVACGYQLAATDGDRVIYCGLPHAGWFPDEDLPPRTEGDPADEQPSLRRDAPLAERLEAITAVLELADSLRAAHTQPPPGRRSHRRR